MMIFIRCRKINLVQKKEEKDKFEKLHARYRKVSGAHGAEIKNVYYITRSEPSPSLYENTDFSLDTVQALIKEGELKTNQILKDIKISSLSATIRHYSRNDFSKS